MANRKVKKSAATHKSANPCTRVKRISSAKPLVPPSIPTKPLLSPAPLPTKTPSICRYKATHASWLAKNIPGNTGSALKSARIRITQGRSLIKLPLKPVLTPPGSPRNPKSVGMDKDGNDITLSDIYAESESQEGENRADIGDISTDLEDETEDETEDGEGHNHEIEEGDEDTLQAEFKATYSVTYKAEFEHKKELSSGSVVCKRHDNDFDLDIHLMRWQRIAGLHATTLGGSAFLVKCSANCSPGGNITKKNIISIDLRLQSWNDAMTFVDE